MLHNTYAISLQISLYTSFSFPNDITLNENFGPWHYFCDGSPGFKSLFTSFYSHNCLRDYLDQMTPACQIKSEEIQHEKHINVSEKAMSKNTTINL